MKSKLNVERLKLKIIDILGEVKFNKEFKKHAIQLNEQKENLLNWCIEVAEGKIIPKLSKKHKDKIIFIKKIGSSNRCLVIKKKDEIFIECHLGDHKYYDYLRKLIGL